MQYKVVYARFYDLFTENVEDAMKEGWVCQGGVAHNTEAYFQAMVKPTTPPPTKKRPAVPKRKPVGVTSSPPQKRVVKKKVEASK